MKKVLLFLLFTATSYGQIATPFDNIKIKQITVNDNATRQLVQDATTLQVHFVAKVLPPFEAINEGSGVGYVVRGRTATVFGNIGSGAFDISTPATGLNSIYGATGNNSFATGISNISSGLASATFGRGNSATVEGAFACGLYGVGGSLFSVGSGTAGTPLNAFQISTAGLGKFSQPLAVQDGTISMVGGVLKIGAGAGNGNTGQRVTIIGNVSGFNNTYNDVFLLGEGAAAENNNQVVFSRAFPFGPSYLNTHLNLTAYDQTYNFPTANGTFGISVNGVPFDASGNVTVAGGGGSGTVSTVSVATANGFVGTVATPTTTPIITIGTELTGIIKGNGTGISIATAPDFPTLNQNTTGTASNVTGVVAIANGGTGQTTASGAITALLPTQTTNGGKFLKSNATFATWEQAVVSVNANTPDANGNVVLNADNIANGTTNKYHTDALSRASVSLTTTGSGASTYNSTTGVLNVPIAEVPLTFGTGLTKTVNTISVNSSQNITTLSNLTTAGVVKTTASGVLSSGLLTAGDIPTLNQNTTGTATNITATTNSTITTLTALSLPTTQLTGTITNAQIANTAVASLSGANSGDNATNTTYANDYRLANFVAGTNYIAPNASITAGTATKITYDSKGLVTAGTTLVAGDIPTIAQSQVTNLVTDLAGKLDTTTPQTKNVGVTTNPTPLLITGSINDFLQVDIKNTSTGTSAQSGFSATADNGTATTGFIWHGKNNSTFNNPQLYNVGGASDGSILNDGGNLWIHNTGTTGKIAFSTGNVSTPFYTERMAINGTGSVSFAGQAGTTGQILQSTGATTAPVWQTVLPTRATIAGSAAINTTATYIAPTTFTIPANTIAVGDSYRITIYGSNTSSGAVVNTFTPRIGTLGTVADTALTPLAVTSALTGTGIPFIVTFMMTARVVGATGSFYCYGILENSGITGISTLNQTINVGNVVTVNTTTALTLGASFASAATTSTNTFSSVVVQKI